jgi:hypothetical protein
MNQPTVTSLVVNIAPAGNLSATGFTGGLPLCGIQMPNAWDAADITFQASCDLIDRVENVYDKDGIELQFKAAAGQFITFDPAYFSGVRYLAIRSGTSSTPVTQSAARAIILALRTI